MKRTEHLIPYAFKLSAVRNDQPQAVIVRPSEIAGVYLRLVKKMADTKYYIFQVNIVISGIEYEVEQHVRDAASLHAKAIADLALLDRVAIDCHQKRLWSWPKQAPCRCALQN